MIERSHSLASPAARLQRGRVIGDESIIIDDVKFVTLQTQYDPVPFDASDKANGTLQHT